MTTSWIISSEERNEIGRCFLKRSAGNRKSMTECATSKTHESRKGPGQPVLGKPSKHGPPQATRNLLTKKQGWNSHASTSTECNVGENPTPADGMKYLTRGT